MDIWFYLTTDDAEKPEEICDEEMLVEKFRAMHAILPEGEVE